MHDIIDVGSSPTCPAGAPVPLERVLFAVAGTVALLSAALVALVSPWFALLTAFAGLNQLLFAAVGACPLSLVLERTTSLRPAAARSHGDV